MQEIEWKIYKYNKREKNEKKNQNTKLDDAVSDNI